MKNCALVDGSSYFYRAFYGNKANLRTSSGLPTGAVYTFYTMLDKLLKDEETDTLVMVFDKGKPLKRLEKYPLYKANRDKMPEDLQKQIPLIERLVEALNIPVLALENIEADDLIGTAVNLLSAKNIPCTIVSGDKDFLQLLKEGVTLKDTLKNRTTSHKEVPERIGVEAAQVCDYLALVGDSADNIPGAAGIGPKGAAKLLKQYGSLEGIYENLEELKGKKLYTILKESKEMVFLSRELATIECDIKLPVDLESFHRQEINTDALKTLCRELEFHSLLSSLNKGDEQSRTKPALQTSLVQTEEELRQLTEKLKKAGSFALDTETTSLQTQEAKPVGISFCCKEGEAYYIPLAHIPPEGENPYKQLPLSLVKTYIGELLQDETVLLVAHNLKYDWQILEKEGFRLKGKLFDTMLASYLLEPDSPHSLESCAGRHLGRKMISYKEVCGSGKSEITFDYVPLEKAADYSGEDAEVCWLLYKRLKPLLEETPPLQNLFTTMEMPFVEVIKMMEQHGIKIDIKIFGELSEELRNKTKECQCAIRAILQEHNIEAEKEINLNSTKQLSELLFTRLGLKPLKKTKTGFSTDMSVLETLAAEHPLPAKIVEYRQYEKLLNTYVEKLPAMVSPSTGRLHTSFKQTGTATGRLSSHAPNLQNIPARTENGKKIRGGFIPEEGNIMISADYSQIELRVLAHFSCDPSLIKAFQERRDIHAETASRLFGDPLMVTDEMRNIAKTVNFGIIYGQTPFGLAKQLNITQRKAKQFIDDYFQLFPSIQSFIQETIAEVKEKGYSETLYGRRRFIPDIHSRNKNAREFAERTAVNSRIQGTAADIMKIAMLKLHEKIKNNNSNAKILIQVHDELVLETPLKEKEQTLQLTRAAMEHAASLNVPLVVDIGCGSSWQQAKP